MAPATRSAPPSASVASSNGSACTASSKCCCLSVGNIALLVAVVGVLVGFSMFVDQPRHWAFDPKVLQQVAKRGIAAAAAKNANNATASQTIAEVIREVKAQYPDYVQTQGEWLFNNAGGAMGTMIVLHASFSEYVIVFGTPLGTEGHTGRFFADDYFTIIHGEQWAAAADVHEKEVYRPGDQHFLPRHHAKQYRMPESCFALEYARGNIAAMMPFGMADLFFSTLDWYTLYQMVLQSATQMLGYAVKGKW